MESKKATKKAGSRGGVGKSGGQTHEWMKSITDGKKYGTHGFVYPPRATIPKEAINIGELSDKVEFLIKKGFATKDGSKITIDTTKMGITKVLGKGKAKKLTIIAKAFSASAKEKLKKAGGVAKEV